MNNLQDFFENLQGGFGSGQDVNTAIIETPSGNIELPDLSNLALVNDYDHDTKTCNKNSDRYNGGNCWNVNPQPYLNSWNDWKLSQYGALIDYYALLDSQQNYTKGEEVALQCVAWANDSLADLEIHTAWINNMQTKINKENRCCVDRIGGNNFNNAVDPVQDALRAELQGFKSEMEQYVYAFQGTVPPEYGGEEDGGGGSGGSGGGGGNTPNIGPNSSGGGGGGNDDSGDLNKFLMYAGGVLVLLVVIVIFMRRRK